MAKSKGFESYRGKSIEKKPAPENKRDIAIANAKM